MGNFVEVKYLDYSGDNASEMTAKTYHGLEIVVNNITVGRIDKYTPPQLVRTVTPVRELTPPGQPGGSFGRIIEQVPGKSEDGSYELKLHRTEVWANELEVAFGFAATFLDLCDQNHPFILEERLYKGNQRYTKHTYTGCWFKDLGQEEFDAGGDAIVKVGATIAFVSRQKSS
jgi:hypothetical protein